MSMTLAEYDSHIFVFSLFNRNIILISLIKFVAAVKAELIDWRLLIQAILQGCVVTEPVL